MRLIGVHFNGYKRLVQTACNVDGRLIAFVGANEAGKTSVLEGLHWLSTAEEELAAHLVSRAKTVDSDDWVVRARFLLDDADQAVLKDLDAIGTVREFRASRDRDSTLRTGTSPALKRNPEPFEAATTALEACQQAAPDWFAVDDQTEGPGDWLPQLQVALSDPDITWGSTEIQPLVSMIDWLREQAKGDRVDNHMQQLTDAGAQALSAVRDVVRRPHPNDEARQRLDKRRPDFLLFGDRDRVLKTEYDLSNPTVQQHPPQALVNLLAVAGTNLSEVLQARKTGDVTRLRTLVKRANRRLEEKLRSAWRQSELAISLEVDGTLLQVLVDELDEAGARTAFTERSDGLRTFIALTCFLAAKNASPAPILLIDEAETHLHLDAQADLVDFLMNSLQASQVIYTTHSPGCLPPDLGTGVRLVEPDPARRDVSVLRADFWSRKEPGFSPLLFAMGAGAAAFSACRHAVLAEGPSDMILLPSLIRRATGESDLRYQIAPGLSGFHGQDLSVDEIAARVAYLVDGDAGGRKHKKRLTDLGVPADRVLSLPTGIATEDLIDFDVYLAAINGLLRDAGNDVEVAAVDLKGTDTVAHAVEAWCEAKEIKPPGKVAVASRLIQAPDCLRLTASGAQALQQLHANLRTLFEPSPVR